MFDWLEGLRDRRIRRSGQLCRSPRPGTNRGYDDAAPQVDLGGRRSPSHAAGGSLGGTEKALNCVGAVRYNEVMHFTLDGEQFELTPESVRARLVDHVPEDIREYWVEIDGTRWPVKQVISLATGVTDRQRFQSQSSRRWLQKLGFPIGSGQSVTESRAPQPVRAAPGAPWPHGPSGPSQQRPAALSCGGSQGLLAPTAA